MGPMEDLEECLQPKVEACTHGVSTLAKISKQYPQLAYAGLVMYLQLNWQ